METMVAKALLEKLNNLTDWQAAVIFAVVGFAVFSMGLNTPFQGDDIPQIVNNPVVHSVSHIKLLFEGGTFYNGRGIMPLDGVYYRPLMMTAFAILYTLFGPHALAFHVLQLLLCIGSAVILYFILKNFIKQSLALFLALIFLVHPIDSQVAYQIAALQDALFFFLGITALWLLMRSSSKRSLFVVVLFLLLSMLAKETGLLFLAMALLCLFLWDRKRLYPFVAIMAAPVILYFVLRYNAVGTLTNPANAPIDKLGLIGRLMTAPSIMMFYLGKLLFSFKLASAYYWVHPHLSVPYVLVPLLVDTIIVALIIYTGIAIQRRASKSKLTAFVFFATWSALGIILTLQITPLDMTASDRLFYFPMAGILGMTGVALSVFRPRVGMAYALLVAVVIVGLLGIRTAIRGRDWSSPYKLAVADVAASKEDYVAYTNIASRLLQQGEYSKARTYSLRSISVFPDSGNYNDLGLSLYGLHDYPAAETAFYHGLRYDNDALIYENLTRVAYVYGSVPQNKQLFLHALQKFPQDSTLWLNLALWEERYDNNADARFAVSKAAEYGQVPQSAYVRIMSGQ